MGLSNTLENIVKIFLRKKYSSYEVVIHSFHKYFIVVISVGQFKGSSSSPKIFHAFIKALSELGEDIIAKKYKLHCRSGLAGGLFLNTAIQRAKEELLERDAFFYHYRSSSPFINVSKKKSLYIAKLNSNDSKNNVVLAFNQDYLKGNFFKFGMGSSRDLSSAQKKAIAEQKVLELNHQKYPDWFKKSGLPIDQHHLESNDHRNILKIKNLLKSSDVSKVRIFNNSKWVINEIDSPIKFLKYAYLDHPELLKIEFGKREEDGVLHPFW